MGQAEKPICGPRKTFRSLSVHIFELKIFEELT